MGIETALIVAGTALSASSAISQGQQASATANYQAAQAQADAEAAKGAAEVQAQQIRDAGKRQRSAATAASAASGFSINDGTAELINNEIDQAAEQDALTTILSGKNSSKKLQAQAEASKISGKNALNAGYTSAIGAGIKGAYMSGWKSSAAMDGAGAIGSGSASGSGFGTDSWNATRTITGGR